MNLSMSKSLKGHNVLLYFCGHPVLKMQNVVVCITWTHKALETNSNVYLDMMYFENYNPELDEVWDDASGQ